MLAPKKNKKQDKKKFKLKLKSSKLKLVAGIISLPILIWMGFELFFWQRIYPGVNVVGLELDSQTEFSAEREIQQTVSFWETKLPAVTLTSMGSQWHILKGSIDFKYLPHVAARQAYMVGRGENTFANLQQKWQALTKGIALPMRYSVDDLALEAHVASVAADLDLPPIEPQILVADRPNEDGSWVTIEPGESGQLVDQESLRTSILERLTWFNTESVKVPIQIKEIAVTAEALAQTKQRAEELIGKSLTLSSGEQQWTLEADEIVNFLHFFGGFDEERTGKYVETLSSSIDRPAQDAAFAYVGGRVTVFRAAKSGLKLNQQQTKEVLVAKLEEVELSDQEGLVWQLPIEKSTPEITLAQVNNLGIKELLGRGSSTYYGSISGRIYNVSLSAQRISGVLVAPGKEFSFNASVGEISAATGYKPAYVIKSGSTVLDDGGGTCQTSTTTFRAALDAGLPITQRRAHSYRVGYYEQNAKAGLDATVYAPSVDLRFLNDTPAHILVQTVINGPSGLIVEIYGTDDGRVSQIVNHRVWDIVPAPPPRYQDDPSLPAGTVKQVDFSAAGAKAKFDYVVTRNGETIHSKTFYSNFSPWQAVYLRGV